MTRVPSCSTCGLAVEWLRSCYESKWFLLTGDGPPVAVAGRYYFSPTDTPFFAGATRLSSRNWYDRNAQIGQGLGEDLAERQSWDNGGLPALIPENRSVGTSACLQFGEEVGHAVPASSLVNGFVGDCFVPLPVPPDPWPAFSDFRSCSIQVAYAKLISWSYDARTVDIKAVLNPMLGPVYTVTCIPATVSFPGLIIAVSPEATFLLADGTASWQEFALQGAYILAPPVNVGIFGTLPIWYAASTYLNFMLSALGANPAGPIFLCGHSYGGAAALLLAARYRAARPDRTIRYLTYGCPKPGDSRLIALLATCQGLCLVNENDIVPTIPPDVTLIYALVQALGFPELFVWGPYRSAPNQVLMDANGAQEFDANPTLDFQTALGFALYVLDSVPYPNIEQHTIDEYFKRSLLRCLNHEWPLTQADYDRLLVP